MDAATHIDPLAGCDCLTVAGLWIFVPRDAKQEDIDGAIRALETLRAVLSNGQNIAHSSGLCVMQATFPSEERDVFSDGS